MTRIPVVTWMQVFHSCHPTKSLRRESIAPWATISVPLRCSGRIRGPAMTAPFRSIVGRWAQHLLCMAGNDCLSCLIAILIMPGLEHHLRTRRVVEVATGINLLDSSVIKCVVLFCWLNGVGLWFIIWIVCVCMLLCNKYSKETILCTPQLYIRHNW